MTDHAEEQEMEAEAMAAIFDAHFEILGASRWRVTIYPETGTSDEQELESINHVGCRLLVSLPDKYPEVLPELDIEIIKGLAADHQDEILRIADEEAEANIGAPSIFAVTERIRAWLVENNIKGLDDVSMHAQMMRKKVLEEKAKNKAQATFEAQKQSEDMTEAEREELEVTKRRAEGTPCNKENFERWQANFLNEMAEKKLQDDRMDEDGKGGKPRKEKSKDIDHAGRMTGFEHFSNKMVNLEALELAAEEAEQGFAADEDLFEDDVDLDELDFDDDEDDDDGDFDEEEDDDEEEELDI